MIKLLLDFMTSKPKINVANVNVVDRSGQTALHILAERGDSEALKYLLSRSELADVDAKDLFGSRTPLYVAAKKVKS